MISTLIKLLVRAFGYAQYFDEIVGWVVEHDQKFKDGAETAKYILGMFTKSGIAKKVDVAETTVLQLCYAYARLKNLIIRA